MRHVAKRELRRGMRGLDRIYIRKRDVGSFSRWHGNLNIPALPRVAGLRVVIESAEPIGTRRDSAKRALALQIGIRASYEIFRFGKLDGVMMQLHFIG